MRFYEFIFIIQLKNKFNLVCNHYTCMFVYFITVIIYPNL